MAGNREFPIGALVKALYRSSGNFMLAAGWAEKNYGVEHAVNKPFN